MVLGLLAGVPKQVCLNAGADWHGRLLRRSGTVLMLTCNEMVLMNSVALEMFFKRGCMGPVAVSSSLYGRWHARSVARRGRWHARSVDGEGQVARMEGGWRGGTHGVWREGTGGTHGV